MSKRAMQETTFLILTALAQGPQHGYGIIQDVARISEERVALRAGTLYGALERLDADGLIAMDREEVVDGRLRRYYRLTDEGTARLAEEAKRLQESAATALQRLAVLRPGLAGGAATALSRQGAPRPGLVSVNWATSRCPIAATALQRLGERGLGLAGGAA